MERRYVAKTVPELESDDEMRSLELPMPPMFFLVSSVLVSRGPMHDVVRIWSRGALAGELTLNHGDGKMLAERLGLELEKESGACP